MNEDQQQLLHENNQSNIMNLTNQSNMMNNSKMNKSLQLKNRKLNLTRQLDSLPLGQWHIYVIISLGITWIFDGYEVSMLSLTSIELGDYFQKGEDKIGLIASFYLLGCCTGSLFFGYLALQIGRKPLFNITLMVYFVSVMMVSVVQSYEALIVCRFLTGVGVGGEYASIFVVIDELVPCLYRGRVDIILDGSWHLGSLMASLTTLIIYRFQAIDDNEMWRYLFLVGGIGVLPVFIMRKVIPESPRWLILQNRLNEAEQVVNYIKNCVQQDQILELENNNEARELDNKARAIDEDYPDLRVSVVFFKLFKKYKRRFFLALTLMISQAFFFNGIFYTFSLVLKGIYLVDKQDVGYFMMPLSLACFSGTLLFGKYFDTWGRRKMIFLTYTGSGILLLISGLFFLYDILGLINQVLLWFLVFLVASPGGSAAHLTVSEIFPSEMRSQMMAIFFSLGLGIGGVFAPLIFGILIKSRQREQIFLGYLLASSFMIFAGIVGYYFGIDAEGKSLEDMVIPDDDEEQQNMSHKLE